MVVPLFGEQPAVVGNDHASGAQNLNEMASALQILGLDKNDISRLSTASFFNKLSASVDSLGEVDLPNSQSGRNLEGNLETNIEGNVEGNLDGLYEATEPIPEEQGGDYVKESMEITDHSMITDSTGEVFEVIGSVRAIYDYDAGAEDELPFQEGDLINLFSKHESGWWTGELNGVTGLFPANHVEEVL